MINKYIAVGSTIVVLLLSQFAATAGDFVSERAERHIANLLFSDAQEEIESWLEDSGLASSDIDKTVDVVIDGYAKCGVESLMAISSPESDMFLEALSNGSSKSELDDAFSDVDRESVEEFLRQLGETIETCVLAVDQENGIIKGE